MEQIEMSSRTRSLADDLLQEDDLLTRRRSLAQAITLVESHAARHQEQAEALLTHLLSVGRQPSFRIGITGPPGTGKSTFIETLGKFLLEPKGSMKLPQLWYPHQVAVLCVDPSSSISGGSILGDKTRMESLAKNSRAYIRPTASQTQMGGLAAYTDDVVTLCETAGYDLVLLETVGVGQTEVELARSCDLFVLLVPPAGGDDLQGVKKGILEVTDLVVVTKWDGSLQATAERTAMDYRSALQFIRGANESTPWTYPPVLLTSAITGDGLDNFWSHATDYWEHMLQSDGLQAKRMSQRHYWMWKNLQNLVQDRTQGDEDLQRVGRALISSLDAGTLTPRVAAQRLLSSLIQRGP